MKKVTVIIEYADKNLSAYIENAPIITVGKNLQEIEDNIKSAIDLYLEDNNSPCELLKGEYELIYKIDTKLKTLITKKTDAHKVTLDNASKFSSGAWTCK